MRSGLIFTLWLTRCLYPQGYPWFCQFYNSMFNSYRFKIYYNVRSFHSFSKSVNKITQPLIGLTESCGGCFNSIANAYSMIGTVGIPNTSIEARLESVPEMEYDALSSTPRGELCLRGNTLFSGYHKRPDLTQEVLIDGWFHTGKYHLCKLSILICVVLWMLLCFEAIINKIL